ncbi:MAG: hypothetical protein ACI9OJ_001310 [Myxococcota bacterium]|jgi:hypothetical protein
MPSPAKTNCHRTRTWSPVDFDGWGGVRVARLLTRFEYHRRGGGRVKPEATERQYELLEQPSPVGCDLVGRCNRVRASIRFYGVIG